MTSKASNGKRHQDRITHAQFFNICQYIDNVAVDNHIDMNSADIAELTEQQLGFPVSVYSIREACKTVNVTFKGQHTGISKPKSKTKSEMLSDIEQLQAAVESLQKRLAWFEEVTGLHLNVDSE